MPAEFKPEEVAGEGVWSRLRVLGRQSGLYLIADAASKGLALFLLPLYLHYLTPADYGVLAIVVTTTVLFTILFSLGLQAALQRIYFELASDDERRTLYASILVFLVLGPGISVVALELLGRSGGLDLFRSVPYDPYLRLAVLTAYMSAFCEIPVAIYLVRGQSRRVLALLLANAILLPAFTVIFVVLADEGAIGAVRAALITAAVMGVVSIAVTIRESNFRFSWRLLRISLVFGLPLVPHLVGHWVVLLADRSVLDRLVPSSEVGIYALGANVAIAAFLLGTALARAFTPALTREMKNHGAEGRVPVLGTWWVATLVWFCTAIVLFAGPLIHLLFDERYEGAITVVPWLVGAYLAAGIYNVVIQGAWFSMRVRLVPVLNFVAGAFNVGLAFLLVPDVGIEGAAISTMIGFISLALMQGWSSHRLCPIPWEYARWAKLLLAGGAAVAVGSLASNDPDALSLAVRSAALLIVLPVLLMAVRFFTPLELAWLGARSRGMLGRSSQ